MRDLDPIWLVRKTDLHHARHIVPIVHFRQMATTDPHHSQLVSRIDLVLDHTRFVTRSNAHHSWTDLIRYRFVAQIVIDLILAFTKTCLDLVFLLPILTDDTITVFLTEYYVLFVDLLKAWYLKGVELKFL